MSYAQEIGSDLAGMLTELFAVDDVPLNEIRDLETLQGHMQAAQEKFGKKHPRYQALAALHAKKTAAEERRSARMEHIKQRQEYHAKNFGYKRQKGGSWIHKDTGHTLNFGGDRSWSHLKAGGKRAKGGNATPIRDLRNHLARLHPRLEGLQLDGETLQEMRQLQTEIRGLSTLNQVANKALLATDPEERRELLKTLALQRRKRNLWAMNNEAEGTCSKCGQDDHVAKDCDAINKYAREMGAKAKPAKNNNSLEAAYYDRGAFGFNENEMTTESYNEFFGKSLLGTVLSLDPELQKFVPVQEHSNEEQNVQDMLFESYAIYMDKNDILYLDESVEDHPTNPKKLIFRHDADTPNKAKSIAVPRHMWEGKHGMKENNKKRAEVYGSENRNPLGLGQIENIHKEHLAQHFAKPKHEQIKAEKEAIERLHKAGHLHSKDTLDKGEKTDTVKHEHDENGRNFEAASSKGVAGHAVYTSGHGANEKHHILNTCPGQTTGCGGGTDEHGHVDSSKGTCFAPKAELQYKNAAIRRATHEQAKHDPAMTKDWVLAHSHSLRRHADTADKQNKRFLFRPNVVDETDRTSRHVLRHLNKQRAAEGKHPIIANSYSKTNELHDPENHYNVTHSNIGPKVKNGKEIGENKQRDNLRVRNTIHATDRAGNDLKNEQGHHTPPRGSYMVTNMHRGGDLDKEFQKHVTHAKYWGTGRENHELSQKEKDEGPEKHYDGEGKETTPEQSHYGHTTVNGRRYDYQKQHILHPRMVNVHGHNIPTDSRFKDEDFLPKGKDRFKSKNGKHPGGILVTTPTTSTSNAQHHSSFTHHVGPETIEHAKTHHGEYEIDNPHEQEKAKGKEFNAPPLVTSIAPAPAKR